MISGIIINISTVLLLLLIIILSFWKIRDGGILGDGGAEGYRRGCRPCRGMEDV